MANGPLIIVSGPSGSGKSTVIARLLTERAWPLRLSVSVTTRAPRKGEQDGIDYYFWTRDSFEAEREAGAFLEWAEVYGNYYGTLCREVDPYLAQGIGVLLDIDVQGWEKVLRGRPAAVSIFIKASTLDVLKQRLESRGSETRASLERRMDGARRELSRSGEYDHIIVNDDLEITLARLREVLRPLFERTNDAG